MTAGSLTQLAAKGEEDKQLTLRPEFTFFKAVYKHYTNFATQAVSQGFSQGAVRLGSTITATIPRKGDLVQEIWLEIDMSRIGNRQGYSFSGSHRKDKTQQGLNIPRTDGHAVSYVPEVARAMIKNIELLIGGHVIDTHSGEWLHVYDQLYVDETRRHRELVGGVEKHRENILGAFRNDAKTDDLIGASDNDQKFYVPLRFWFNNTCSQCLPLVALMYHEVEIRVKLRTQEELMTFNMRSHQTFSSTGDGRDIPDDLADIKGHKYWGNDDVVYDPPRIATVHPHEKWWPNLTHTNGPVGLDHRLDAAHDNVYYSFPEHGSALVDMKLLINYTFLDKVEREMFAKNTHYYLMDTITEVKPTWMQKQKVQVYDIGDINHPCKELIWCVRPAMNVSDTKPEQSENYLYGGAGQGRYKWDKLPKDLPGPEFFDTGGMVKDYFNFDGSSFVNGQFEAFETARLTLNGAERFEHDARFLREVISRDKYNGVPETKIYKYPFCKNPQSWKPSGSLNFSRIDQARLELDLGAYAQRNMISNNAIPNSEVFVFAKVHNILKISAGMAGVMYH